MAYLQLTRPLNVLMVLIAVITGDLFCYRLNGDTFLSALAVTLILIAGNIFNDYCDYDIDKLAHPDRPLPSGDVSKRTAIILSIIFAVVGLVIAFTISKTSFIVAGFAAVLLLVYSLRFSSVLVVGNLMIAFLTSIAVVYGNIDDYYYTHEICARTVWAAIIAGTLHFGREIFKDMQDIIADTSSGRRTLAIVLGERNAGVVAFITMIFCGIMIVFPYMIGVFGEYYAMIAIFAFICCGLAGVFGLRGYPGTSQKIMKAALVIGIVALWVEAFTNK